MTESNPLPFHPQADIIEMILKEVKRLKKLHPWPDHVCAQAGKVTSEAGKLAGLADHQKYKEADISDLLINKAITTAAQAIRFIEHFSSPKTIKTNDTTTTESAEDLISQDSEREG